MQQLLRVALCHGGAWWRAEVTLPLFGVGVPPAAGVSGGILEVGAALGSISSSEVVLREAGQGRRWWLSCLCPQVSFPADNPGCGGSQEEALGDF